MKHRQETGLSENADIINRLWELRDLIEEVGSKIKIPEQEDRIEQASVLILGVLKAYRAIEIDAARPAPRPVEKRE